MSDVDQGEEAAPRRAVREAVSMGVILAIAVPGAFVAGMVVMTTIGGALKQNLRPGPAPTVTVTATEKAIPVVITQTAYQLPSGVPPTSIPGPTSAQVVPARQTQAPLPPPSAPTTATTPYIKRR